MPDRVNKYQAVITKQKSELDQTKSEKEGMAVATQQERRTLAAAKNENLKKLNIQASEHIQRCEREISMLRAHVGV